MLIFVTGASGSGKTAVIPGLRKRLPEFDIHDFDERDVPSNADTHWRQQQTEYWINKGIENQRRGRDTIICGGAVYGEILACPSIHQIDDLAVCLLDCSDIVRIDRMRRRGTNEPTMEMLCWAAWLRVHAVDPSWCPEVIMEDSYDSMKWENWQGWERGDPRWHQPVVDTSGKKIDQITTEVVKWIEGEVSASYKDVRPDELRDDDLREEDNGMPGS